MRRAGPIARRTPLKATTGLSPVGPRAVCLCGDTAAKHNQPPKAARTRQPGRCGSPGCPCRGFVRRQQRGSPLTQRSTTATKGKRYGRKWWKATADRFWAQTVKDRDGWTCQHCGATASQSRIEAAHIVPRGYGRVRHDPANGVALCNRCHARFTGAPVEFDVWISERIGRDALWDLKYRGLPRDPETLQMRPQPDYEAAARALGYVG